MLKFGIFFICIIFFCFSLSCGLKDSNKNISNSNCGLTYEDSLICANFDNKQPQLIIAVVGDGVKHKFLANDRAYQLNRAQGEAMWNGIELARNNSKYYKQIEKYVKIVGFDDGASGECADKIASFLYYNPCVIAVIGHATSQTTLIGEKYYKKSNIPVLMPIATSPNVFYSDSINKKSINYLNERNKNLFRLPPSDDKYQTVAIAYYSLEVLKSKSIFLLKDNAKDVETYSEPIYNILKTELLGPIKKRIADVTFENSKNIAYNIKSMDPDLVIFCGYWSNFEVLISALSQEYSEYTKKPNIILSDGCLTNDLLTYGFNVWVTFPSPDLNDTILNNAADTTDLNVLRDFINKQNYQSYELYGYDALHILSQAIIDAQKDGISRSNIVNILTNKKLFTGACFDYNFENGENKFSNYYIYNVNSKYFEIITKEKMELFKAKIKQNKN